MKRQQGFTLFELLAVFCVLVLIPASYGWGMNIYKLCTYSGEISGILIARAIGIFIAPLGAVLGFL